MGCRCLLGSGQLRLRYVGRADDIDFDEYPGRFDNYFDGDDNLDTAYDNRPNQHDDYDRYNASRRGDRLRSKGR